jgi:hypothetical protein
MQEDLDIGKLLSMEEDSIGQWKSGSHKLLNFGCAAHLFFTGLKLNAE